MSSNGSDLRQRYARRAAGIALLALPVLAAIAVIVVKHGWMWTAAFLAQGIVLAACLVGGMRLVAPRKKRPADGMVTVSRADLDTVLNRAGHPDSIATYPAAMQRIQDAINNRPK